jgi:uncharacterized RDD family membrane protein YckC
MSKFQNSLNKNILPKKNLVSDNNNFRYAGANIRVMAVLLDLLIILLVATPFLYFTPKQIDMSKADLPISYVEAVNKHANKAISEEEFRNEVIKSGVLNSIIPKFIMFSFIYFILLGVFFIFCWKKYGATPGKIILKIKVLDEETGQKASIKQLIIRYFSLYIAFAPIGIGYFIINFNKRRKGLHDYIAKTIVVYTVPSNPVWEKRKLKLQTYFMLALLAILAIYLASKL